MNCVSRGGFALYVQAIMVVLLADVFHDLPVTMLGVPQSYDDSPVETNCVSASWDFAFFNKMAAMAVRRQTRRDTART